MLQGLSQEILATPGIRARGARVASAQADASQVVVRACFGEAAVAGSNKGKVHLLVWENFARLPRRTMFSHSDCQSLWSK